MNINITIVGQVISFIIFVFLCMKYIWTPMISIIEKRQKEISDTFASIEKSKKISEIDRIKASDYLEKAKKEAKLIIEQANQYKIELMDQIKIEAQNEKKRILSQTYNEIDIEKKRVAEELQREISEIIILGIEKILKCSINSKCIDYDTVNDILNELLIGDINFKKNGEL